MESERLLDRISFTLDQLKYEYPHEPVPEGWDPQGWLEHLTLAAAQERFPGGVPDKLHALLNEELPLIRDRKLRLLFPGPSTTW